MIKALPLENGLSDSTTELRKTPLHALHLELGARMVPFAGYSMPVQYPAGLMAEHHHTRRSAGLFDVSHMGQLLLQGAGAAEAFESLVPVDVLGLATGRQRYGLLLDDDGGILDDLMFFNRGAHGGGDLVVVVNGANKAADLAHITQRIGRLCQVVPLPEQALLALQGPQAAAALRRLHPEVDRLRFMDGATLRLLGADCLVTRSGYTGEDGFEISVPAAHAEALARALLDQPEVRPIGLGARNSLRLEAGLPLHGNDIDRGTTPAQAGLSWAIQKVRRHGGARSGGFPGAQRVLAELEGADLARRRVGLVAAERVPVREHTELRDGQGMRLGEVCSGLLSPTLDQPIAMAYVPPSHAALGTEVFAQVRGRQVPMRVSAMPFVPHHYHRG